VFSGSIVALVTPMQPSGAIDWSALDRLLDWHLESGTHGVVPVGTTGESATLAVDEHLAVIERTVKRIDGRIPVIAGTGANSTREAIHLTQAAKSAGADACLSVTPYYNKPIQEGLYRHYCAIAEAVDLPMLLYNVPGRTACDMKAETVSRLAQVDHIIGIKEACGDAQRVAAIRALCPDDFVVLSGEDALTLEMMTLGAVGTITVTGNVCPKLMSTFVQSFLDGDRARAAEIDKMLQPIHQIMFIETSPQPVKWALHEMDRIDTGIRLPLIPMTEAHRPELRARLKRVGAL
jgi:4-hydroxy-tetrahydrodipicolinate synthase